jgi:subtilisin-like proprotein convertase family protein
MFARKLFDRIATRRQSTLGRKACKKARNSAFRDRLSRNMRVEALEHRHLLAVFSNPAAIAIPDSGTFGPADPYPSTISVALPAGVRASMIDVNATLSAVSHTAVQDISVLLTAPAGGNVQLMTYVGGGPIVPIANETWTFDDSAPGLMPEFGAPGTGTFRPSGVWAVEYPPPAPEGPFGTTMAAVAGGSPVGDWHLFVFDRLEFDTGAIASGWSLDIQLGGDVIVDAGTGADDGVADAFLVELSGSNLVVSVNGVTVFDEPLAGVTSLTIHGSSDNDTLTVDFGNGAPLPSGGLSFDGGTGFDTLEVVNYNVDTLTVNHDASPVGGPFSGTVHVGLGAPQISFSNIEPLVNAGTAAAIVYNLPGTDDQAVLEDVAPVGMMRLRSVNGTFETTTFSVPTNSLSINLGGGDDVLEVRSFDSMWTAPNIHLDGQVGLDEIRIGATPAGTTTDVNLAFGVPDRAVLGAVIGDPDNTATNFAQFNAGVSTVDLILGAVHVRDSGGIGSLYVDDSGNTTAKTVTITGTSITGVAPGTITYVPDEIQDVGLALGSGDDTISVLSTSAPSGAGFGAGTVIYGNDGDDTFTINGDNLSGFNSFRGGGGNDQFLLNITNHIGASGLYPILSLDIHGDALAADSENRDRLIINDNNAGFIRNLNYQYDSADSGGLGIQPNAAGAGLFGAAGLDLVVRTMETVIFNSAGANDIVRVTGTDGNDLMTVALLPNNTSALFFLDGDPYLDYPPATIAGSRPGVAGGGSGPDLLIHGLAPAVGITLDGGGTTGDGDRAIIYAAGEDDLVDVGNPTDIFGFGPGVLQPGFGVNEAFDTMTVDDGGVTTLNNAFGALTRVNLNTASFVQNLSAVSSQRAALIVNGGDEAAPQPGLDTADVFYADISPNFNIQVNGNLPLSPFTGPFGQPQGDELNVFVPGSVNVFSDGGDLPYVTVTGLPAVSGPFGVRFSSIERSFIELTSGIVNIIGDNNTPGAAQNDVFVVRGQDTYFDPWIPPHGRNQFSLEIGGNKNLVTGAVSLSAPIFFRGVTRINASGGAAAGFDPQGNAISEVVGTGVDTLDITPYADNTPTGMGWEPLGWGIETHFNEGDPVHDGDLLIYNGVPGVSEQIVIQPSAPEAGQVFSTNAATGTPIAVVNYVLNTAVIINANDGSLGDTDTLVLRGTDAANPSTSGSEDFVINLDAAGTATDPVVTVHDAASGDVLYHVQEFTNISTLTIEALGGHDTITVLGQNVELGESPAPLRLGGLRVIGGAGDDSLILDNSNGLIDLTNGVFFDGGPGNDQLWLTGTLAVDTAAYTVGPQVDDGFVLHARNDARQRVYFTGLEPVIDLVPAAVLEVQATAASNVISYGQSELNPDWGKVSIDGFEPIHFANKQVLIIHALGGSDTISLNNPVTPVRLTEIIVNGGDPTAGSDTVIVNGTPQQDQVDFAPGAADAMSITGLGPVIVLNGTQRVIYNGQGGQDDLTYTTPLGHDEVVFSPGSWADSGSIEASRPDIGGNIPLLGLTYQNVGANGTLTFVATGLGDGVVDDTDWLVVRGTDTDDRFVLTSGGQIQIVRDSVPSSPTTLRMETPGISRVLLQGLDGDDTFKSPGTIRSTASPSKAATRRPATS